MFFSKNSKLWYMGKSRKRDTSHAGRNVNSSTTQSNILQPAPRQFLCHQCIVDQTSWTTKAQASAHTSRQLWAIVMHRRSRETNLCVTVSTTHQTSHSMHAILGLSFRGGGSQGHRGLLSKVHACLCCVRLEEPWQSW